MSGFDNQHAGKIKCTAILKEAKNYINGTKWDGNTSVSIEKHINNLRRYYNDMENSADHIAYQLSNSRTKVQIFWDPCIIQLSLPWSDLP